MSCVSFNHFRQMSIVFQKQYGICLFLILLGTVLLTIVLLGVRVERENWGVRGVFYNHSPATERYASYMKSVDLTNRYVSYANFSQSLLLRCRTCALVTGSGHLKKSGLGKEIDGYECVARTNDSPTIGYEKDVGSKTTIRVIRHQSLPVIVRKTSSKKPVVDLGIENELFILPMGNGTAIGLKNDKNMAILRRRFKNIEIYGITEKEMKRFQGIYLKDVDNKTKGAWFSNGFYSLLFLREICGEIHAYGISHADYCRNNAQEKVPYHYYNGGTPECAVFARNAKARANTHRFFKEKKLFQRWLHEWGNLHFHCPEWERE